jgi:23S rRNA pseudouridine2605 synthase
LERLQKILAAAGVASRRKAEELITAGRVEVDGVVVTELGTKVDPATQEIRVKGKFLPKVEKLYYIALNKPVGVVSTVADKYAKETVVDLVQIDGVRLVPAGRLDADSEGLMFLSNDGDFIYKVTHPSQSLGKTYHVTIPNGIMPDVVENLARGLMLPGETRATAPARVKKLGKGQQRGTVVLEMTIQEGRNRQIRRMLDMVNYPVQQLVRVKIGTIEIGNLAPGQWRDLTELEVASLMTTPLNKSKMAGQTVTTSHGNSTSTKPIQPISTNSINSTKKVENKPYETNHSNRPRQRPGESDRKSPKKRS